MAHAQEVRLYVLGQSKAATLHDMLDSTGCMPDSSNLPGIKGTQVMHEMVSTQHRTHLFLGVAWKCGPLCVQIALTLALKAQERLVKLLHYCPSVHCTAIQGCHTTSAWQPHLKRLLWMLWWLPAIHHGECGGSTAMRIAIATGSSPPKKSTNLVSCWMRPP